MRYLPPSSTFIATDEVHRGALLKSLQEAKIPAAIYYPKPLHLQTAFASLGYAPGAFPLSEAVASRIFSLPMHPYLEKQDQEKICQIILGEA